MEFPYLLLFHFTLLIHISTTWSQTYPIYDCSLDEAGSVCTFSDIQLTETEPRYQPTVKDVTELNLGGIIPTEGSRMRVFTSDTCYAFPYVKKINADYLGITELERGAFESCSELEELKMSYNHLIDLSDQNLFKNNTKLRILHFYGNRIHTVDPRVFSHLTELEELSFGINSLATFPIGMFGTFNKLKKLYIDHNLFPDIEEKEFKNKFPNLEYIHICPNSKISSERMEELLSYFKSVDVRTNDNDCE